MKLSYTSKIIYIVSSNKLLAKLPLCGFTLCEVNSRKRVFSFHAYRFHNTEKLLLKKLKTKDDDYIITGTNKYLEPRTYRKYFNKVLKLLKIKEFNFHSLRHTFATNCISLGVDYKTVSELLGHANVNITLNLYVHPRLSQKKKCIDMICKVFQESI